MLSKTRKRITQRTGLRPRSAKPLKTTNAIGGIFSGFSSVGRRKERAVNLDDMLNKMGRAMSVGNSANSSNTDDDQTCRLCGKEPICEGLGVVRYDVPVDDPRFGKLFRCPNNPVEKDTQRQDRLRRLSNLDAYADKTFDNFVIDPSLLTASEAQSLHMALRMAESF